MSVNVPWNGQTYPIPNGPERNWGPSVTALLQAMAATALTQTPTLSAELDLGATWGIRAPWFRSATANPAATGVGRFARVDTLAWRNHANDDDITLGVGTDGLFEGDGVDLVDVSTAQTLTNKTLNSPTLTTPTINNPSINAPIITGSTTVGPAVATFGASAAAAATVVAFLRPGYEAATADTTEIFQIIPFACKLQNLYVFGTGNSVGGTTTVTVRKNGVDTALTCTVLAAAATANDTNAAHAVSFSAGDRLSIKMVSNSGVSPAMTQPSVSVMVTQA